MNSNNSGYFCITIDTEEEGRWGGGFPRQGHSVEHIKKLPALQSVFDGHGVKPVYFINYPVITDDTSCKILKEISDDGRCEIATHVHPWCNPPYSEKNDSYHSYLSNLPYELQKEKIQLLTGEIEKIFWKRPRSFRSGRYGFNEKTLRALESLGYTVDSSVTPFMNWNSDGGPAFMGAPNHPYFPDSHNVNKASLARSLLEVPVSVGYNRTNFERADSLYQYFSRKPLSLFRIIGILNRLHILQKIFLTPEISSLQELIKLSRVFVKKNVPVLVMMFHSTSISPGKSPYVRDESGLKTFYGKLDKYIAYATSELKLKYCTLSEYRNKYFGGQH